MLSNKSRLFLLLSMCTLVNFQPAQACDTGHNDCLSTARYSTIAECNTAIAKDKNNFHAWLDRAVLETRQGLDESAASDFEQAGKVLEVVKAPVRIAKAK